MTKHIRAYVLALFRQILGEGEEKPRDIQMDRVHQFGLPRGAKAHPPDILVCVHDFQLKERILRKARDLNPIAFRGHQPMLFQDLADSTLIKRRSFKPITNHLREQNIPYSWGHPFRLIFKLRGKLLQIRSLDEAYDTLGTEKPPEEDTDTKPFPRRRSSDWQRVGKSPPGLTPGVIATKLEREAALSSVALVTERPATP